MRAGWVPVIVSTKPGMIVQAEQLDGTESQAKDIAGRFHILVGRDYKPAVSLPDPVLGMVSVQSGDGGRRAGKGDWIAQGYGGPVWIIPGHFFAEFFESRET